MVIVINIKMIYTNLKIVTQYYLKKYFTVLLFQRKFIILIEKYNIINIKENNSFETMFNVKKLF